LSVEAVVSNTTLVVVALIVGNAISATFVLVALSEPLCLVCRAERAVILSKKSCVVGARSVVVGASASSSICRRSCNVNGANVVVITLLDVLADSVLGHANIDGARIVVVTVEVLVAPFPTMASLVSCNGL